MNSELTQLADSARQVVEGQGLAADEQAGWQLIAELGWLMVAVPEEQGGLGMGPVALAALHSELGRGLATMPFLPHILAIDAVAHSDLADSEDLLAAMMSGERRVATPLAEASLDMVADGNDILVNGSAFALPSLDLANYALVASSDNQCLALVAMDKPGITVSYRPTWDVTRRLFELHLKDVRVSASRVLARGAAAVELCRRLAIQRDFALACDAAGGASALLEKTVEYLQTRQQFGRPLALFQALKHRCADLKAEVEGARALLDANLAASMNEAGELGINAAVEFAACESKKLASDAFAAVAEESLQLHGGIGMTEEHECHLFLKRALLNEHLGGPSSRYTTGLAARYLPQGETCAPVT